MSEWKLARLEKELGSTHTEGVSINLVKGTSLYTEIKCMLKKRAHIHGLKCMALL